MSDVANTPIMIGVTGKRDLAGDDNAVRKALRWCFALLDEAFPASRKLLLSGTAAGTDTIAAEEALDREGRTVAAVLPLELNLYIQDFDTGDEARLRNLLANPRVSRCDLEVLIDPSTGRGFTDQALTRKPDQANPSRADHYEQAGLYIAERSTLLIGVMYHDEMPDRIGGTARKVDFRLRSSPDRDARRIIQNGHRLRAYSALDNFERGPVWLIDMRSVADNTDDVLHAVQLWKRSHKSPVQESGVGRLVGRAFRRFGLRRVIAAKFSTFHREIVMQAEIGPCPVAASRAADRCVQ